MTERHLHLVPPLGDDAPPPGRLVRNAARCQRCAAELESVDPDEPVTCACGDLTVWGGLDEAGRSFNARPGSGWSELAEYEEPTDCT